MRTPIAERVGAQFERLLVIGVSDEFKYKVVCQCDCGNLLTTVVSALVSGATKSCGCLSRENTRKRATTHGATSLLGKEDPLTLKVYRAWMHMKDRCLRPNTKKFKNYGGRGIDIQQAWVDDFPAFLSHVGLPKDNTLSLDRIDNQIGYLEGNVQWATLGEQNNNKRTCKYLTYNGVTQTITQWARELGINPRTLHDRIEKGMSVEAAFSKPIIYNKRET